MCGRFAQFSPIDVLKAQFVIETVVCNVIPDYNITPSQEVLSIVRRGGLRLGALRWGLVPPWMKEKGKSRGIINARSESLAEKPLFAKALAHKRCLIPADGYYEWGIMEGKKMPYYFYLPSKKPFGFAGIWDSFHDNNGNKHSSCAIITREAEGALCEIHSRMPVILDGQGMDVWLDSEMTNEKQLQGILADHSICDLSFHRVTEKVNSASFNEPGCVEKVSFNDR